MQPPPNPYAPPVAQDAPAAGVNAELEAIRKAHLTSETNIKTIGSLAILGAALQLMASIATLAEDPGPGVLRIAIVVVAALSGMWIRDLKPVGRTVFTAVIALNLVITMVTVALSSPNAAVVPVLVGATIVPGLFLWVMWNAKALVVFSDHYRQVVIPATPYVKYKTSKVAIVLLILLLIGFVAAIVAAARG